MLRRDDDIGATEKVGPIGVQTVQPVDLLRTKAIGSRHCEVGRRVLQ